MYLPPDVCIYIMYTYQMQDMYNTCCFPSPSATQPFPHPPFLSPPRPTSSRWVPPYVPWLCLRFLPDAAVASEQVGHQGHLSSRGIRAGGASEQEGHQGHLPCIQLRRGLAGHVTREQG